MLDSLRSPEPKLHPCVAGCNGAEIKPLAVDVGDEDGPPLRTNRDSEQAETNRRQKLAEAATREAKAAEQQVAERLRAMAAVLAPSINLPIGVMASVLEARHRAAQAEGAADVARERITHLMGRQQALEQRRSEIIAKRQAGSGNDAADGAELALIAADSVGLSELVAQAAADAEGPARQAVEAAAAINHAEQLWQQAVESATSQALAQVCMALEAALVECATRLYPSRLTGGSAWRAGRELRHILDYGSPQGRTA